MSEVDLKKFFLEQVRLFESFPADKVEKIVNLSRLTTYEGNEAMLETGDEGRVIGVIPEFLEAKELAHRGVSELRVVASMHERKALMADLSDGFIALPGGFGTLEEITEMLTWTQLGLQAKPIVFFDVEGYWSGIFRLVTDMIEGGFVRSEHESLVLRATYAEEALALATGPVPEVPHKWIDLDVR